LNSGVRSLLPVALASATAAALRWLAQGAAPLFPDHDRPRDGWICPCSPCSASVADSWRFSWQGHLCRGRFSSSAALPWMWGRSWWRRRRPVGLFSRRRSASGPNMCGSWRRPGDAGFLAGHAPLQGVGLAVALGSGTSGGVLGPLCSWAAPSAAHWPVWRARLSGLSATGLWPVICMAAVFGGAARVPLTASFSLWSLPMKAHPAAGAIRLHGERPGFTRLLKHSIMTEKIARRGLHTGTNTSWTCLPCTRGQVHERGGGDRAAVVAAATAVDLFYLQGKQRRQPGLTRWSMTPAAGEHGDALGPARLHLARRAGLAGKAPTSCRAPQS